MKLSASEYVVSLCNALETKNPEGQTIAMNLLAEHKAYRDMVSYALKGLFLGSGQFIIDGLFHEKQEYLGAYQGVLKQQAAWAFEKDEPKKEVKPKRTIQSAPKVGKIAKKKIEEAVKAIEKK